MAGPYVIPTRQITKTDEYPSENITVRRWINADGSFHHTDVFVGGWRVGSYKTDAGAARRVAKEMGARP
jgi:hypothetical protein